MLSVLNVSKKYSELEVLNDVTIKDIGYGLTIINGQSGSGKTTLLNIISGIDKVNSGSVVFDNIIIDDFTSFRGENIGYIFQNYCLIEYMTIKENLQWINKDLNKINKVLKMVRLLDKIDYYPSMLSGGQKQRVGIARVLLKNPNIILADEPTGALNEKSAIEIMKILKRIGRDHIVIMVSHNIALSNEYADRHIIIENGRIKSDVLINNIQTNNVRSKGNFLFSLKQAIKNTLISYRQRQGRFNACVIAFVIGLTSVSFLLGLSKGIDSYISSQMTLKLDHNYFQLSKYQDGLMVELPEILIQSINDQDANVETKVNLQYYANTSMLSFFKSKTGDNFDFYFEVKVLDFVNEHDSKKALVNSYFFDLYKDSSIIFSGTIDTYIFDADIIIEDVIDDGTIYNSPTLYLSEEYFITMIEDYYDEICFNEKIIPSLFYSEKVDQIYDYLNTEYNCLSLYESLTSSDTDYYLLEVSNEMVRSSFSELVSSGREIFFLMTIMILLSITTLISLVVSFNLKSRYVEIGVLQSFGVRKKAISYIVLSESCLLGIVSFVISQIITLVLKYICFNFSNLITKTNQFDFIQSDYLSFIITLLVALIISFFAAFSVMRKIAFIPIKELLKQEE